MKKLLYLLLTLFLLAGLLAPGCISLRRTTAPATGTGAPAGGNLNLAGIDPYTLDPALAGDVTSAGYIIQIFSGLARLDDKLLPVPDLAESWDVSPDGKVYTFHLRRDVVFQDGRPLTAADVKYSWERAASPATGSTTAATYLGDIVGVTDMLAGKATSLSGVEAADSYTLRVTLVAPRSYFLAKLTYMTGFVVDKNNVAQGGNWWLKPNGTGPFRLQSYSQGDALVLARNARYYGQKALLNTVTFKLLAGVPMDMYELGQIDVAGVGLLYYDRITDPSGPFAKELSIIPQLALEDIAFDTTRPPFDDPAVRQAFVMAVDKAKIARLLYRGTTQPLAGVLPPGMPGYNPYLLGLPFDVAKAKALIAGSKYGSAANLPKITLTVGGYGNDIPADIAAVINEWRVNLGVEVEVRQLDPEYFNYYVGQDKDQLIYWAWGADYAHPQDFLDVLFGAGQGYNVGGYENAAFNDLLRQAAAETDEAKSLALYQQAEQVMVTDAACLPLWAGDAYVLVKPYVHGYAPNALGWVMLNQVSVSR